jgi:hypothetical protein
MHGKEQEFRVTSPASYRAATRLTGEIFSHVSGAEEAWALPCGAIVGDTCGGRSFSDNVAAVLEKRSDGGWLDVQHGAETWTLIRLSK